jgi:hypothetical protein
VNLRSRFVDTIKSERSKLRTQTFANCKKKKRYEHLRPQNIYLALRHSARRRCSAAVQHCPRRCRLVLLLPAPPLQLSRATAARLWLWSTGSRTSPAAAICRAILSVRTNSLMPNWRLTISCPQQSFILTEIEIWKHTYIQVLQTLMRQTIEILTCEVNHLSRCNDIGSKFTAQSENQSTLYHIVETKFYQSQFLSIRIHLQDNLSLPQP